MKLQQSCEIHAPLETVWELTSRIDEIAPCLPGGSAVKIDQDHFDTTMKVRLGPLDLLFRGKLAVTKRDAARQLMVLSAKANETRGQGGASAVTTIRLRDGGSTTQASIETDLVINGRVAQMGRGIVAEVADDLLARFVANMEKHIEEKGAAAAEAGTAPAGQMPPASAEPISVGSTDVKAAEQPNFLTLLMGILWRRLSALFRFSESAK